jgi:hypothetical protein
MTEATGLEPRFFCHNWLAVRHFAHIRVNQFLRRWVIESVALQPEKADCTGERDGITYV